MWYRWSSKQNDSNSGAEKKRNGIEKYQNTKTSKKVILQLNAAINKYVLHILTLSLFHEKQIAIIGGPAASY
jgi:hypothetical protein